IPSTPSITPTPSNTPVSAPFPSTGVLDSFDRSNGVIGGNWSGATAGYTIGSNQLDVNMGGDIYWNPNQFAADQEAYITLTTTDPADAEIDLLLKAQSS